MSFEKLNDEELKTERGQLDAALRMAVSQGAVLPEEAKARLQSMNDEVARREAAQQATAPQS